MGPNYNHSPEPNEQVIREFAKRRRVALLAWGAYIALILLNLFLISSGQGLPLWALVVIGIPFLIFWLVVYRCPVCGTVRQRYDYPRFCENCGARLRYD